MAPFNWFSRDSKTPAQTEDPSPSNEEAIPASNPQSSDDNTQSGASADDYLSWAKAAYQNIQQQKQQSQDTAPASSEEPSEATTTQEAPSLDDALSEQPKSDESADSNHSSKDRLPESATVPDTSKAEPRGQAIADNSTAPPTADTEPTAADTPELSEASSSIPATSPESTVQRDQPKGAVDDSSVDPAGSSNESASDSLPQTESTSPPTATPLPFWAKAETERQERLERLKAEAIEEPEPEPQATPDSSTSEQVADVEFDENFIWSAGVLAAQGRRPEDISAEEITWLKRLRQGLGKTRRGLINQLRSVVGQGPLNQDAVMEIESLLLQADVGIEATDYVIEALQERMRQETLPPEEAIAYLKEILCNMLDQPYSSSYEQSFTPDKEILNIWLMTGVNGAGKTTTIGKLAHMARQSDYTCLIAAADTFRAAAVEQVKIWGQRSNVEVIANPGQNTDPAAVVFDAISAARARDTELLLVDTAGRLQNKKNLMAELNKIRKILDKKAPDAKIESLLVLDATLGQNGLRQAEVFAEAAQLSGVVLTKLDGTAKGGVALAVVKQLGLPIRFIGAGEGIEDLRPFSSYEFVEALLSG